MSTKVEPSDEALELVARHGSGQFVRSLAAIKLAKRHDRMDEFESYIDAKRN